MIIASSAQNTLDDNMQGAYISAVLPGDGIYLLWITGENGTTGDFALTLLGQGAPVSTPLIFGQAVDVTLVPAADPQLFSFEAEDCPTTLLVTNVSEGQPFTYPFVVKVYDQRGQTVALLHGGEELEDWVTVTPRSERYEVEVSSDHLDTGTIRLLVTCAADAPGCVAGQRASPAWRAPARRSARRASSPAIRRRVAVPRPPLQSGGRTVEHARQVTVMWDAMPGATGYTVTVYGRTADSGDVYLTHAVWGPAIQPPSPGSCRNTTSPSVFCCVAIGDDVVCVAGDQPGV